ncbi:FKBP-type peptidyl-prolyl cis-trans isomerase [Slackia heliotrinireducens]|jgi:FKBP-type peptidyl-prolyl cis-trans isomerase 2|uniref:Peptidyl-prolyl cis-trans isomerase n=1 Tax=Slackia heliotrinireducens (strain ATCC 29202 / DSM 20476 / NCTC 11029 / RHS 1) TaxID=471855 RepID=C7N8E0_SLAHD|nr:peptidylprolyl isomerase [Slackia heliotrinireducens]ACV23175.1 FKBP-type peptidyl-prolyl cis-trans isomerase [Slackia heliotrinireducens DSM 20476]VEH02246.1 FKBP-type peptidyl-prolyl cis-trans isomerase slyD [Slackia heliotrinireducens]
MSNQGKKVKAHYRGTLDDGTQFDSSYDRGEPLEFTAGAGQMIPGFDAAVLEMAVGEKKTVHIPAKDAYGEHNPEAVQTVPVAMIPGAENLPVGQTVYFNGPMGPFPAKVVSLDEQNVVLDMNHELAGKDLTFEIELVEVEG